MAWKQQVRPAIALVALLIASILVTGFAFAKTDPGKDRKLYAVIVGVGQYQDPNIPSLSRAAKDAKDFHAFLQERKQLFSTAYLTMLLNEEATRANVARALRQELRRADPDDIVIIYLSGHGLTDPVLANEFYFATHDARLDNLFGTALLMNDTNLFKGIKSDNVLLLTDACHSGGFNTGLDRLVAKSAHRFFSIFEHSRGRIAMSSSRPEEESYEKLVFGNSIFTHFLLKGLRGAAAPEFKTGIMTVDDLHSYVHTNTRLASKGLQNPQIYAAKGVAKSTPVFLVPKSAGTLNIKVQFFYETENKEIKPLTNDSVLKSGQHVGVAFRPQTDCYVYIYWWDSTGKVGRLFPNPKLTEGTGKVVAGKTYWLPYKDGERWYVLDTNPGTETIYFVASRQGNQKLEDLYGKLVSARNSQASPQVARQPQQTPQPQQSSQPPRSQPQGQKTGALRSPKEQSGGQVAQEMKRELSLMGFANYTVPKGAQKASFSSKEHVFEDRDNIIRVSGAEAVFKIQFQHVSQ